MSRESGSNDASSVARQRQNSRIEQQRLKYDFKLREQSIEQQRVSNESINALLSVVRYLNAVQDGDALRIEGTYNRTDIDKPSRILNCHEEDIMNASLITMKKLITSLLPAQRSPSRSQDVSDEPLVESVESQSDH